MVIVLQYEFEGLEVTEDSFSVTLNFDDIDERITVPFMSLINFIDPSVKFGLQFMPEYTMREKHHRSTEENDVPAESKGDEGAGHTTNVISLDDFRKK
jgi:hypothetical protein